MTTSKRRLTLYLTSDQTLEALYQRLRALAPIEARGALSRSVVTEAAIAQAWADVQANGPAAAIFQALVTLPQLDEVTP